ncbi:MAG: Co2+/Mg2+ efflux protein ApaG [Polyangiaceae bacterium]|nr:Co2+/Mg2+ efflux protein ApaG [Polyangiaceae bacterium]MCW5791170.1 Co2+/Mg2+ efflux protein ApaG [Polyangiaceae bacterium]
MQFGSEAVTRGVRIQVVPRYLPEQSQPERGRWFYVYQVSIVNEGEETVQLLSRHWIITDARGEVQEVRGPGVVGEQPVLATGEQFDYVSGCPLPTPFGSMRGSYQMVTEDGERFDAEIAPFSLSQPDLVQ